MVRINLLPWREERRKQRQQQFYMLMGGAVGAGVKMRVIDLEAANFYDGFAHGNSLLNGVVGG